MIDKQKLLDLLNENFKENVKWMDKNLESFNENRYNHLLQHAMEDNVRIRLLKQITEFVEDMKTIEDNVRIRLLEQISEFVEDMKTLPVILKEKEPRFRIDYDYLKWFVVDTKAEFEENIQAAFNYGKGYYKKDEAKILAEKECKRLNKEYGDSE